MQTFKPTYRPRETAMGFEITLDGAAGIICPDKDHHFDRDNIVKRAVRIGIFDTKNKEFIGNMAQIPILGGVNGWNPKEADKWNFNKKSDAGLNPVLFRHSVELDDFSGEEDLNLIFEFVVYLKKAKTLTVSETSCGWAELELAKAKKDLSGLELEVHGGSSLADIKISKADLDAAGKRSGLSGFIGMKGASKSYLKVSTRKESSLELHEQQHLKLMPSLCLVHKRLLHFVSGFRSYAGKILLKDAGLGQVRQPAGNVAISTFPHIIDNPDILEIFVTCWEVAYKGIKDKFNVQNIADEAKEMIWRVYPILFADGENDFHLSHPTDSAVGNPLKYENRLALINSALKYDSKTAKSTKLKPIEEQTSFKPFNVREINFEVIDTAQASQEQHMRAFDQGGHLAGGTSARSKSQYSSVNQL